MADKLEIQPEALAWPRTCPLCGMTGYPRDVKCWSTCRKSWFDHPEGGHAFYVSEEPIYDPT